MLISPHRSAGEPGTKPSTMHGVRWPPSAVRGTSGQHGARRPWRVYLHRPTGTSGQHTLHLRRETMVMQ